LGGAVQSAEEQHCVLGMQVAPQALKPVSQAYEQPPPPQTPMRLLAGSLGQSLFTQQSAFGTQPPLQAFWPVGHEHAPPFAGHTVPAGQLFGLAQQPLVTQTPLHSIPAIAVCAQVPLPSHASVVHARPSEAQAVPDAATLYEVCSQTLTSQGGTSGLENGGLT
jgi:hypothetical protein